MKLRLATKQDTRFLFELKNDPEVRKYSILSHNPIEWKKHLRWVNKHLHEIQIIVDEFDDPVGDIRIENSTEVAIKIIPLFRGFGVGKEILQQVIKKGMKAKILDGNIPSMRLFIGLGFKPTKYIKQLPWHEGYYIFEL